MFLHSTKHGDDTVKAEFDTSFKHNSKILVRRMSQDSVYPLEDWIYCADVTEETGGHGERGG